MCKASYDIEVGQKKPTVNTTSTNKTNTTVDPPTPTPAVVPNVTANQTNNSLNVSTPIVPQSPASPEPAPINNPTPAPVISLQAPNQLPPPALALIQTSSITKVA
jgi:hypothetical protein